MSQQQGRGGTAAALRLVLKRGRRESVRPHQLVALRSVWDPKQRVLLSGVLLMPCGSGKTLVAILAMTLA